MEGNAETKRFELLIQFPIYTLSRRAPSATRTSLPFFTGWQKYSFNNYMPNIFSVFAVVTAAISSIDLFLISASFSTIYFK